MEVPSFSIWKIDDQAGSILTSKNRVVRFVDGFSKNSISHNRYMVNAQLESYEDDPISIGVPNQPPVARAGADQSNIAAGARVVLDGSASSDPDGTIVSHAWTQTSGTTVSLQDAGTSTPEFDAPSTNADQTLTFRLLVTDNNGATHTDTVDIGVLAALIPNQPPVARAGADQSNIAAGRGGS